ncbi:polyketide synthase dehydratase domain-containing protein [Streptomyces canus]|uniref:polyketide synthase dehydratase domain-containing protein n=1 Tax=Streptomyces canus TaxID=58343 RepID=UPI0033A23371
MTGAGHPVAGLPEQCRLLLRDTDFILRAHRVHGVSVLPGVTFLDMVLRVLRARGIPPASAELRNIVFAEAIATAEGFDRDIRLRFGAAQVVGESRWLDGPEPFGPWRENFRAELHLKPQPRGEEFPPCPEAVCATVGHGAPSVGAMAEMYAHTRARNIRHGPAMTCTGTLITGQGELLAELALAEPDPYSEGWFQMHPAKLDAATIVAYAQTRTSIAEPFIPMFIERFHAPRPLPGPFTVHVPRRETLTPSGELFESDLLLYDENRRPAARFDRLTCKRIREAGLIDRLLEETVVRRTGARSVG